MPENFTWAGKDDNAAFKIDAEKLLGKTTPSSVFELMGEKSLPRDLSEVFSDPTTPAGATIMIVDNEAKANVKHITNKFLLRSFNIAYQEKAQVIETFGASHVSFFGSRVKVYNFTGVALEAESQEGSYSAMHQSALNHLYENALKGSKLVRNDQIAILKIMNHYVYGYPLSMSVSYNSAADKMGSFNMSWVVAKHEITGFDYSKSYSIDDIKKAARSLTESQMAELQAISDLYDEVIFIDYPGLISEKGVSRDIPTSITEILGSTGEIWVKKVQSPLPSFRTSWNDVLPYIKNNLRTLLDTPLTGITLEFTKDDVDTITDLNLINDFGLVNSVDVSNSFKKILPSLNIFNQKAIQAKQLLNS